MYRNAIKRLCKYLTGINLYRNKNSIEFNILLLSTSFLCYGIELAREGYVLFWEGGVGNAISIKTHEYKMKLK